MLPSPLKLLLRIVYHIQFDVNFFTLHKANSATASAKYKIINFGKSEVE